MVECLGNLCAAIVRWEWRQETLEDGGPTRLASTVMNNRAIDRILDKGESKDRGACPMTPIVMP